MSQAASTGRGHDSFWTLILIALVFLGAGGVLFAASLPYAAAELSWAGASTTTGRVIVTEWEQSGGENRLRISYAYTDGTGAIYHTTGVLGRKLGKLNLEPGARVGVMYRAEDHSQSRLTVEALGWDYLPLVAMAAIEIVVGVAFVAAALKGRAKAPALPPESASMPVKNDNTRV